MGRAALGPIILVFLQSLNRQYTPIKKTRETFPAGSIFQTLPSVVCTGPCPGHSRPFLDWQSRIDRPLLFPFKVNRVSNALAWLRVQMKQAGRRDKRLI